MQGNKQKLEDILSSIPEFTGKQHYMGYFVQYERPQVQKSLYGFWVRTIDILMKRYFQLSVISFDQLVAVFNDFQYKPLCLPNIVNQMQIEGKIQIVRTNTTDTIKVVAELLFPEQIAPTQSKSYKLAFIWNKIKNIFMQRHEQPQEQPKLEQCNIIYLQSIKESQHLFTSLVEKVSYQSYNTFTVKQILKFELLSIEEIELLIRVYTHVGVIMEVGRFNIEQTNQLVYIYKTNWDQDNTTEIDRNIILFKLQNCQYNLNQIIDIKEQEINEIDKKLTILASSVKSTESDDRAAQQKYLFTKKTQLINQIKAMQPKILVIQNQIFSIEIASNDKQMATLLEQVNSTLQSHQFDYQQFRDSLDQLADLRDNQGQITNQMRKQSQSHDDIEQLYQQYELQGAKEQTVVQQVQQVQQPQQPQQQQVQPQVIPAYNRRSKWFDQNTEQQQQQILELLE